MTPQALDVAREFFLGLLRVLGESGRVEVVPEGEGVYVDLRGAFRYLPTEDAEARAALSRLARLHLKSHHGLDVPVLVDINGEVAAHREKLAREVRELAARILAEGGRVELPPMPPDDRRVVHMALAGMAGIRTVSIGRDQSRRVMIEAVPPEENRAEGVAG